MNPEMTPNHQNCEDSANPLQRKFLIPEERASVFPRVPPESILKDRALEGCKPRKVELRLLDSIKNTDHKVHKKVNSSSIPCAIL